MTTVFDIATELLDRSGGKMETVKLQKLCFYAFGWYAHLTGEPLFGEKFYAMEYGPVVGELLSAHAKQRVVDLGLIATQREAREDRAAEADPYKTAVVDAVWAAYGSATRWELVKLTHEESVWTDAWESRQPGTRRGDLASDDLIDHFLTRFPTRDEPLELPPAMITRASITQLSSIEGEARVHAPFVDAVRTFSFAQ